MVKESQNSVSESWKLLDGLFLIIVMLNLTGMVKERVVDSSETNAAAASLIGKNMDIVQDHLGDVVPMVKEVQNVLVIARVTTADTSNLM